METPVTIIVGQNGCGKTTLIEALRMASTGKTPPGAGLKDFIHDPKLERVPEVKAQIRMQFQTLNGQVIFENAI